MAQHTSGEAAARPRASVKATQACSSTTHPARRNTPRQEVLMAEKRIIHAALGGPAGSNIAYFFRGDQYVVYDWTQDRVTMGMKSIADDWVLDGSWGAAGTP